MRLRPTPLVHDRSIRLTIRLIATASLAVGLATAHAVAVPLTVDNPGFEDITGQSPVNEFTFGPPNDWELYDPNNITGGGAGGTYYVGTLTPFEPDPNNAPGVYANFPDGAPEGQRVAIAFNFEGSGNQGEYGIQQTLSATLQPNTAYRLDVEVGNIASAFAMSGQFFDLDGFPGYRVELLAGDEVLNDDNNLLAGLVLDGEFATSTVAYATGTDHDFLDEDLTIRLINLNQIDPNYPDSDLEVDFDDVRLIAIPAIPGDVNVDGVVDGLDANIVSANFLSPGGYAQGDANLDGTVNGLDANVISAHFLQSNPATAIPEPTAFALALLALNALAFGRRRHRRLDDAARR